MPPKRILVAPLDWGLGHAARCIPIVRELLRQGAQPVLATNGSAYRLLKKEFPNLPLVLLPAYGIRYYSSNMIWNMMIQLPKIAAAIIREHFRLRRIIKKYRIDAVISDNRFGCFSKKVKCIFVSHQLNIKVSFPLFEKLAGLVNHWFIGKYAECWVPDSNGPNCLSGALSHPSPLPAVKYIGILSRMTPLKMPMKYDVIVVLSGPEPQRTFFEKAIIQQAKSCREDFLIVQGKTGAFRRYAIGKNIEVVSYLKSAELNQAIEASEILIGRSGYSTLMDLAKLGKKAILVPSPGQTEQEYLAEYFLGKGVFYCQKQRELDLQKALMKVKSHAQLDPKEYKYTGLKAAIEELLASALPVILIHGMI